MYALLDPAAKVLHPSGVYEDADVAKAEADGLADMHSQQWQVVELAPPAKPKAKSKGK